MRTFRTALSFSVVVAIAIGSILVAQDKTSKTKKTSGGKTKGASVVAQQWSRFRGPSSMGTTEQKDLPTEWSDDNNIAWKIETPGAGASSPIVAKDRIYLTTYSGYFVPWEDKGSLDDLKRHLLAIDPKDGSILWNKPIKAKLPEESQIRDHGFAASTPAADEDRVYVFFGKTGVFAFDHGGKQLWQADVGETTNGWGSAASPVLYKDLVIINASVESESVVALDRATGKEVWRQEGIKESWNTPIIVTAKSGRAELIVPIAGKVLAFDPDTGKPLWSCATDITWYMVPSVVAHDGVVYCIGGRNGIAALAVRAGGEGDVTDTHRLWTSRYGSNVSSPVFLDGHLYFMNDSQGRAYCAEAATGKLVYEERLERAEQIYASALLANGKIYYVTRSGRTFVIAAKPKFEQIAINDIQDRSIFDGSPAVMGNKLLIRSNKFLYCLGK
jgi:outer membrane protein assembly factor BamB